MTELLFEAILTAQMLAPEDQDRIAELILTATDLPVIEA